VALRGLLTFDLVGPMAHFRKFYTNSSSLSYVLPPRTTLCGVLASLLGYKRDEYYEELSLEQARIGVALRAPVRTIMQTVNYLFTKNEGWDGSQGHTQIPVNFVLPKPPERLIRYRVYLSLANEALMRRLYQQLRGGRYQYPLYLGVTECPAWVENPHLYASEELDVARDPEDALPIVTAVPVSRIVQLPLESMRGGIRILKDRMPLDLHRCRRLRAVNDILWEAEGRPIDLHIRGEAFRLPGSDAGCEFYGVFLEP